MPEAKGPSSRLLWLIIGFMASVMLAMLGTLANYAWQDVRVDASTALDNSIQNRENGKLQKQELDHLKTDIQKGQQQIIETLYVRPDQRVPAEKPQLVEEPE